MKSLLFIGPWPPPFGGIASHLYELLPGLEQNGYKINILSFSESKQEINFVERGVHVNYFSPSFYFFNSVRFDHDLYIFLIANLRRLSE